MKIIINCSTLSATGATQVALSFIMECIKFDDNEYHIFVSKTLSNQINEIDFPKNFKFYKFNSNKIYSIMSFKARSQIRCFENKIQPQCVFTVFGPSWIRFRSPSIFGYAYPHYVYPDSPYFQIINIIKKCKIYVFKLIHTYYLKKHGDYFICETTDVSERLSQFLKINRDKIFTVGNTYSSYFEKKVISKKLLPEKLNDEFRFLCLFSLQDHKNILILNKVIPYLKKYHNNINIKFILTIDKKLFNKYFNTYVSEYIINLGRVDIIDCPSLFSECDATFLPTLLECFSANYPESMKMGKPILTSNLSFAQNICGNAALFFDPLDEIDISKKIVQIISDHDLRTKLIANGFEHVNKFETPESRAIKYLTILKNLH